MFTAANPLFLWLLPVALAPVVFHLFFRARKRRRPFPTLMFFQRIDPHLSARRRIREWLVLLLRALAILLLLLGLARLVRRGAGPGLPVAAVIVIDNSGSMSAAGPDGRTRLALALDAAHALVGSLQARDSAGVVLTVADPLVSLPAGLSTDRAAVGEALDRVLATEASGSPADAIERAAAMLERRPDAAGELHVFTDLQEAEWGRESTPPRTPGAGVATVIHRIPSAPSAANVTLLDARIPDARLIGGRRQRVDVTLLNASSGDARVQLVADDDAGGHQAQDVLAPARAEKVVRLQVGPLAEGPHWIDIRLEGDAFPADNRAAIALSASAKRRIVLAGEKADFGALPAALAPAREGSLSGLVPEYVPAAGLAQALGDPRPSLTVVAWGERMGAARAAVEPDLRRYVEQGGRVLFLPSARDTAFGPLPGWAAAAAGPVESSRDGVALAAFDRTAPLLDDLRDEHGELLLRNVRVFRYAPLDASEGATHLLGLPDGRPLLVQRAVGRGTVFVSGLAFDSAWSTLPLKAAFLPLAQGMALAGHDLDDTALRIVAGVRPRLLPESAAIHLRSLAGSPLDWKGAASQAPVLARAGVYAAQFADRTIRVAVRAEPREGRLRYVSSDRAPALGGIAHTIRDCPNAAALLDQVRSDRAGLDLFAPFVLAAILALLAEGWLANAAAGVKDKHAAVASPS